MLVGFSLSLDQQRPQERLDSESYRFEADRLFASCLCGFVRDTLAQRLDLAGRRARALWARGGFAVAGPSVSRSGCHLPIASR